MFLACLFGLLLLLALLLTLLALLYLGNLACYGIIIGKGGQMLKKIGSQARPEIEDMLEMKVNLQLWVKVKKDWRDSDILLKNFGYNPKDIEMGE